MVEKVDLEITRFDLKPQIRQFRYLNPFFHPLIFYFYTGGKMVEKWIWKLPDMSLSLKLPTLHIWLIFFYFSTFQPRVKLVEKMDLEASKN